MSITHIDKDRLERMQACTTAQEAMQVLADEGFELNDEQLEAIAGGAAANWTLEDLLRSFGDSLGQLFPEGFDPASVWGSLPLGGAH